MYFIYINDCAQVKIIQVCIYKGKLIIAVEKVPKKIVFLQHENSNKMAYCVVKFPFWVFFWLGLDWHQFSFRKGWPGKGNGLIQHRLIDGTYIMLVRCLEAGCTHSDG